MGHTPLPWHIGQGNGEGSIFSKEGRMRLENGGTTLYPICNIIDFNGEQQANAEFIVRACNSHYELLEACEKALYGLKSHHRHWAGEECFKGCLTGDLIKLLENTIQKAKGGE